GGGVGCFWKFPVLVKKMPCSRIRSVQGEEIGFLPCFSLLSECCAAFLGHLISFVCVTIVAETENAVSEMEEGGPFRGVFTPEYPRQILSKVSPPERRINFGKSVPEITLTHHVTDDDEIA